jgi:hypothetical protein
VRHLTDAVNQALDQKNWYAALTLALTLPDICGAIESRPQGNARYVSWCDRYLTHRFGERGAGLGGGPILTGRDCYLLRCAVLHAGEDDLDFHREASLRSFRLMAPGSDGGLQVHFTYADHTQQLQVQVQVLCRMICDGVDQWLIEVPPTDPGVAAKVEGLLKVHPMVLEMGPRSHSTTSAPQAWHATRPDGAGGAPLT